MSQRMNAPEGCMGVTMADGTRYSTDHRTGQMQVDDRHVGAVRNHYGALGLINVGNPMALGTKGTRWCWACTPAGKAWQSWTTSCPRCGAATSNGEQTQ